MKHDDQCAHGQPLDGDCPDCEAMEKMKRPGGKMKNNASDEKPADIEKRRDKYVKNEARKKKELMKEAGTDVLDALIEMREVNAVWCRAITVGVTIDGVIDAFDKEMKRLNIESGFGIRADAAIRKAKDK